MNTCCLQRELKQNWNSLSNESVTRNREIHADVVKPTLKKKKKYQIIQIDYLLCVFVSVYKRDDCSDQYFATWKIYYNYVLETGIHPR